MRVTLGTVLGLLLGAHLAPAEFLQQGPKLVGTGAVPMSGQGYSVAVSADGNTAIVGGPSDNSLVGAAWVWTRSGGVWTQQGEKLVGSGAIGAASQGRSVAISADGNTAIVGGDLDDNQVGAAWVWTRSGGVWTQQGSKLVGSGAVGNASQGSSVALSADGNTAIVGGHFDNNDLGAAWVWTRSAGTWAQQGGKLVGSGAIGEDVSQGISVALSADGNSAIVGGHYDDSLVGAAWVWTRSGGAWTQQGSKLVGSGAAGVAGQGLSVAISADGSSAAVGGLYDDSFVGAAWVWTRSGGVWAQQGSKLVGAGSVGPSYQGEVALSVDGNRLLVGGRGDSFNVGATWVWIRSGEAWTQQGSKLVGAGATGWNYQGGSVSISADGRTAVVGGAGNSDSNIGAAWVFVASPARLDFLQQPTTTLAGRAITPPVTVQLLDTGGSPVALGGFPVTISLTTGTGNLGGTLNASTGASGLATFADLSIDLVGSKRITAASTGLAPAVSSAFAITAGAEAAIAPTRGETQSTMVNTSFPEALQVMVADSFGNPVSGVAVTFGAPASGPSATLSSGGRTTTDASGRASVAARANGVAGGPYAVTASVGFLAPARFNLTNLPDPPVTIPALDAVGLIGFALILAVVGLSGMRGALRG